MDRAVNSSKLELKVKFMNVNSVRTGVVSLLLCLGLPALGADENQAPESATFKGGKVLVLKAGKLVETTNEVAIAGNVVINTNGVFKVGPGKARQMSERQTIDAQGMLTSPDGSVVPVFDHYVLRGGRVEVVQDGEAALLAREFALPDGARISPDGSMRGRDGRLSRLLDGQLMRLDGSVVPVTDTISLKEGKVVLFKDGGRVELKRTQVISMSDGTRVTGDGGVTRPDGSSVTLKEGETIKIPGVLSPRR
jgi:hypothetical protein